MTKPMIQTPAEHTVLTEKGWRSIREVCAGETVLTHHNRYRKVSGVDHETHHASVRFDSQLTGALTLREDQPVFVRKQMFPPDYDGDKSTLIYSDPWWVNAAHLDDTFYIGVPINQETALPDLLDDLHIGLSDWLHDMNFWWVMGKLVKQGQMSPVHLEGVSGCVERPTLKVLPHRLYELTALLNRLSIPHCVEEHPHYARITLTSERLSRYLASFGDGNAQFQMDHRMMHLPIAHIRAFVQGYLNDTAHVEVDGWFTLNGLDHATTRVFCHLLAKGYRVGHRTQRLSEQKSTVAFYLHPKPATDDAFYLDGHLWCPASSVIKQDGQQTFVTLYVEEDGSYVIGGATVHDRTSLI